MKLRPYHPDDCPALAALFFDTVHTVNCRDYSANQCDALESAVRGRPIETHASITARPFFTARGYRTITEQQVVRHGVRLTNFVMRKP